MEQHEADELNLAFGSDLQACSNVQTKKDLAALLLLVDSYGEGDCRDFQPLC